MKAERVSFKKITGTGHKRERKVRSQPDYNVGSRDILAREYFYMETIQMSLH